MQNKSRIHTITILAISTGFCAHAMATPIFTFTEHSGFSEDVDNVTYSGMVEGDTSLVPAASPVYSMMSWGGNASSSQSSLQLVSVDTPTSIAENTWTTISSLTHNNLIIPGAFSWNSQNIWGRFIVTDADGGADVVVLDSDSSVNISLTETPNTRTCASPNPVGSLCDDYFTFTGGLEDLFFSANDGSQWQASFRFANLVNAAQVADTIFTGEDLTSSLDVQVLLIGLDSTDGGVQDIPEPATLGLLGFGLLGLGKARRRRQAPAGGHTPLART